MSDLLVRKMIFAELITKFELKRFDRIKNSFSRIEFFLVRNIKVADVIFAFENVKIRTSFVDIK